MKTNKVIWIILGILASFVVLYGLGIQAIIAPVVTDLMKGTDFHVRADSDRFNKIGAEIVVSTLPGHYRAEYAISANDYRIVGYTVQSEDCHANLLQLGPTGYVALEEIELEPKDSPNIPTKEWLDLKIFAIKQRPVIIRGEEHVLAMREGSSGLDQTFRVALTQINCNSGPTLLAISGSLTHWNKVEVEQFIVYMEQ